MIHTAYVMICRSSKTRLTEEFVFKNGFFFVDMLMLGLVFYFIVHVFLRKYVETISPQVLGMVCS